MSRPSTSSPHHTQDVDARDKPGHDGDLEIPRLAAAEDAVFVEATRRSLAAKSSIPTVAAVEARMHARAPPDRVRPKINSRGQSDPVNFPVDDRGAAPRYRDGDTP